MFDTEIIIDGHGREFPKSLCCQARMYATKKTVVLAYFGKPAAQAEAINYIYCEKCRRHLDGDGKLIEPPQYHTEPSMRLSTVKLQDPRETMEYWEKELWQIIRYHNDQIKVILQFSPMFGIPTWTLTVYINGGYAHGSSGTHLWKRLKKAHEYLTRGGPRDAHPPFGTPNP